MRDGLIEGFREGFGDNDLVLPRLEDFDKARFTVLAPSITLLLSDDVSVSSQALLSVS